MDLTAADIAQNKAINELAKKAEHLEEQLATVLAMLDKLQSAADALAPVLNAVAVVEKLVHHTEAVVSRLEAL